MYRAIKTQNIECTLPIQNRLHRFICDVLPTAVATKKKQKTKNKKLEKLNFIIILYFLYYSQESMKSGDIPKRSLRTYENFYYKMQTTKI